MESNRGGEGGGLKRRQETKLVEREEEAQTRDGRKKNTAKSKAKVKAESTGG